MAPHNRMVRHHRATTLLCDRGVKAAGSSDRKLVNAQHNNALTAMSASQKFAGLVRCDRVEDSID